MIVFITKTYNFRGDLADASAKNKITGIVNGSVACSFSKRHAFLGTDVSWLLRKLYRKYVGSVVNAQWRSCLSSVFRLYPKHLKVSTTSGRQSKDIINNYVNTYLLYSTSTENTKRVHSALDNMLSVQQHVTHSLLHMLSFPVRLRCNGNFCEYDVNRKWFSAR